MSTIESYENLKHDYETYQTFAEGVIQKLSSKNILLEKKLDCLVNIVEISKYINSNIYNKNLMQMINDMMIGILGVTYSTILTKENDEFIIKSTNIYTSQSLEELYFYPLLPKEKFFRLNCNWPLSYKNFEGQIIHSIIGVPIYFNNTFIGYIIAGHTYRDFFTGELISFITSIANQIGIALENASLYNKLLESSNKDPLLNIYNRKYFFDTLNEKLRKSQEPFATVIIDIDNFKKVNDTHGHSFGDEVLIKTSNLLKKSLKGNILARYGGEEFIACVHKEDISNIYNQIEDIRNKITKNVIKLNSKLIKITCSFGISYYPNDGQTVRDLLDKADYRLYLAKNTGKNKVIDA
ncbi:diguanylate cyclase (GGDEF)-like protein [Clostridium pascui]|uniref:GGDEF domain-containing protein n=1 Tax=Clostridium pascui TaxID=46609 RepID=UPI001956E762|nr:sensor domain-containing diguanylate cyclase [Clostridium pascui]MBM7871250.1 diguanylate cyclase (GGDEF)-like protein [Clostridium pascui]